MDFCEFYDYKNQLMGDLCSSPEIVRLVTDDPDSIAPDASLRYSRIFPYEYVPETIDDGDTFICFDVDIAGVVNKTFYLPVLYIWIFTHKSKLRLSEGGLRLDRLSSEINRILNGNRMYGLGKLAVKSALRFNPAKDYRGRVLTYTATDINGSAPKMPPANRHLRRMHRNSEAADE